MSSPSRSEKGVRTRSSIGPMNRSGSSPSRTSRPTSSSIPTPPSSACSSADLTAAAYTRCSASRTPSTTTTGRSLRKVSDNGDRKYPYLPDEHVVEVHRGPEPGGPQGAYRAFGETLRGLKTTFSPIVEGPVTIQYPEEKPPGYPRFPGPPKLHRFQAPRPAECV